MGKKTWMALGAAAAAAVALASPAAHAGNASIYLNIGQSAPYYGYGYQEPAYVYTQPTYVYTQPGYVYTQPSYGHRHHYRRDRDRDGIPNRFDRDRDGDGVPNRFDRRPNNPYRY